MEPYDPEWMSRDLAKPTQSPDWIDGLRGFLSDIGSEEEGSFEADDMEVFASFSAPEETSLWTEELRQELGSAVLEELIRQLQAALARLQEMEGMELVGFFASKEHLMEDHRLFLVVRGGASDTYRTIMQTEDEESVTAGATVDMESSVMQAALFVRPAQEMLQSWLEDAEEEEEEEYEEED